MKNEMKMMKKNGYDSWGYDLAVCVLAEFCESSPGNFLLEFLNISNLLRGLDVLDVIIKYMNFQAKDIIFFIH